MKSSALVFILGLYLSCFNYVNAIKCFICDPDVVEDCRDIAVDCGDDEDLGHAFNSCYINDVLAEDKNGTVYTQTFKSCGIIEGCQQMTDMRCEEVNKTYENSLEIVDCRGYCCNEYDYCNADRLPTSGTAERPRTTETTDQGLDVQGYKSNSELQLLSSALFLTCWVLILLEL